MLRMKQVLGLATATVMLVVGGCGGSGSTSGKGDANAGGAQGKTVKVGLVAELSGSWARQGQLILKGAQFAVDEINAQGGVKSLGGAKLALVTADTGTSTESAASAAQRLVAQNSDLVGGTGAWLSSFTLALTEVTERAKVPWVTLSLSDSIVQRGYQNVFISSTLSSKQAQLAADLVEQTTKALGRPIKNVAIVSDNTAALVSFVKPLREYAKQKGWTISVDELFSPPLADATSIVQKVRAQSPDVIFFGPTATQDAVQLLDKLQEFNVHAPLVGIAGGSLVTPEYLKAVGKERLENLMVVIGTSFPLKGHEELEAKFTKAKDEPWMVGDSLSTYANVWLLKEALEAAGSTDREKVRAALAAMDLQGNNPTAHILPGDRVRFAKEGWRVDAQPLLIQWQGGQPYTVSPENVATRKLIWPAK